jgi:hypothetical protein
MAKLVDTFGIESVKSVLTGIEKDSTKNNFKGMHGLQSVTSDLDMRYQAKTQIQPLLQYCQMNKECNIKEIDNSILFQNADQVLNPDYYRTMAACKSRDRAFPSLADLKDKPHTIARPIPIHERHQDSNYNYDFNNLDQSMTIPQTTYSFENLFDSIPKSTKPESEGENFNEPKFTGKRKQRPYDKQHQSAREPHLNNKGEGGENFYQRINNLHKNLKTENLDSDVSTSDAGIRSCKSEDAIYDEDDDPNLKHLKPSNVDGRRRQDFDYKSSLIALDMS